YSIADSAALWVGGERRTGVRCPASEPGAGQSASVGRIRTRDIRDDKTHEKQGAAASFRPNGLEFEYPPNRTMLYSPSHHAHPIKTGTPCLKRYFSAALRQP